MSVLELKQHKGFSLIETMISTVIMSSGLTALASLLLTAVGGTADTADQGKARLLADGLAAQMQISQIERAVFLQASATPLVCDANNACSAAQFAQANLAAWQLEVARRLPGGAGVVCRDTSPWDGALDDDGCDAQGPVVIKVFWRPLRDGRSGALVRLTS